MDAYKVEDLTTKAPASDLVAVVYYERLGGYVEVYKDGSVKLISPAGTVSAKFRELEKRDLLRENYIQTLIVSGVRGAELEKALEAIARVDKRLAEEPEIGKGIEDLEGRTEAHLRQWCAARGVDYSSLSEEELTKLVSEGVKAVRERKR
ncbi:MAG: hypothetical protein ACE5NP_05155 [Anaerolineae bacterium]